jgi:hypothetical protein
MHAARLIVLSLLGRRFHSEEKHKHAHTYLQFCADDTNVASHACIHKVSARWPTPAVLDAPDCKQAAPPHDAISCASDKNIYDPITIAQGLRHPAAAGGYLRGADVDTLTDWDRIRCKDGQLFATGYASAAAPSLQPMIILPPRLACHRPSFDRGGSLWLCRQVVQEVHATGMRAALRQDQQLLRELMHALFETVDHESHTRA